MSARLSLALMAAVALTLSGCGGDDSSEEPTASASAPAGTEGPEGKAAGSEGGSSPSAAEELIERSSSSNAASKATSGSSNNSGGTKKGPRVVVPAGTPEPKITSEQRATAKVVSIALRSPALAGGRGSSGALPAAHTCDGENSWPAMQWDDVPPGTEELALIAMSVQPVEGEIFVDWAVSGLDPSLGGIEAGQLPKGAVMGKNSYGDVAYSICPPEGKSETYIFALYALPQELSQRRGFDPLALREQAGELSRDAGLLAATYTRG
jgi:phosphatidylethanolamine-binding protein (PEBP) family uncharacterized protein